MNSADKKAAVTAVIEGAMSAARAYGGEWEAWLERAKAETCGEFGCTAAELEGALNEVQS